MVRTSVPIVPKRDRRPAIVDAKSFGMEVPPSVDVTPTAQRKAQKQFVLDCLSDNQQKFLDVLEEIREKDPRCYAKLYVDFCRLVIPKESKMDVNIGITADFQELQALSRSGISSNAPLPKFVEKFDDAEEIP